MTAIAEQGNLTPEPAAAGGETLGDLLRRLGGVSPDRIRMHPAPGTATVADVVTIEAREKRLFELVDGVLVEKGMGYRESVLTVRLLVALGVWVQPRKLGELSGADGMMQLFPKLVRIPDIAFASWGRFPGGKVSEDAVPHLVPDLAVEVLSESNTAGEMKRKREEYFAAGVLCVWEVDGRARTVKVYRSAVEHVELGEGQVLDGGDVLPGFTLELKGLFEAMGR